MNSESHEKDNVLLYNYKLKLDRIIDGDTFVSWIDLGFDIWIKEAIRLYDVDTPEIYGRYAEESGKWASLYAKLWFSRKEQTMPKDNDGSFLLEGNIDLAYEQTLPLAPFPDETFWVDSRKYNARGKYGRLLGEVFRQGDTISLNQSLINAGYEKIRLEMFKI